MPDQNRLPRLIDGLDLRALPIGPAEAFVLSRVDGTSTEADIAAATGLDVAAVAATLSRLVELGAVRFESRPEGAPRVARAAAASGQYALGSIHEESASPGAHPGALLYDPAELEEKVELDLAKKRQILDTFYRLDQLSHYELLSLDLGADRRALKAKYYDAVNLFHPDRYYGKKLGTFKPKLEKIFQRVTEAHEVLTRQDSRADYDAYLQAERRTQALDRKLNNPEVHARELRAVQARIEAEASAAGETTSAVPPPREPSSLHRSTPPGSAAGFVPNRTPSIPAMPAVSEADLEFRRRALARKLGRAPTANRGPVPASLSTPETRERAIEDLRRRYDQHKNDARRRQVAEYASRAETALGGGNVVDAVNALRIASSLAPDDTALRTQLADLEREASREMAGRYLEQAKYEEREKRWVEAARSYTRALVGMPGPRLKERIAHCLLSGQGDIKRALDMARAAVNEAPNDAKYRVTLARAFSTAHMKDSALGELERAFALAPDDESIKDCIRRAKRGEF